MTTKRALTVVKLIFLVSAGGARVLGSLLQRRAPRLVLLQLPQLVEVALPEVGVRHRRRHLQRRRNSQTRLDSHRHFTTCVPHNSSFTLCNYPVYSHMSGINKRRKAQQKLKACAEYHTSCV